MTRTNTLSPYCRGMLAGSSWKQELTTESSFDEVVEIAAKTLFKQKGLRTKLDESLRSLEEKLESATAHAKTWG